MEIIIHNVLDGEKDNGDYTMLGVGSLELPASDETIEAAMRAAGVTYRPYTAAAFGYYFELGNLNGKIIGDYRLDELNRFARYLTTLKEPERERLVSFAARRSRLTPSECMLDTPVFWNRNEREFVVALLPEEYHSAPGVGYLHLPATDEEFIDAIDRARTDGCASHIEVRECKRSYLRDSIMEYPNLYELNHLAQRLIELTDNENLFFEAMVRLEKTPPDIARLINLTYNLGDCVLADTGDLDELGRFAVEGNFFPEMDALSQELLDLLDYEKIGLRFQKEQNGIFVDGCFVANLSTESEMVQTYKGDLPVTELSPRRIMRLFLEVSQLDNSAVYLDLPASLYDMNMAAKRLGWETLSGHSFINCRSSIPRLDEAIIGDEDIYELSDFAEVLDSIRWDGDLPKYKAALEITERIGLQDFIELAEHLDQYEFRPEIVTAFDYGEWEMLSLYKLDHTCPGMEHFDFAAFGHEQMEQQGACITPYGFIRRTGPEQTLAPDQQANPSMGGLTLQ